MVILQWSPFNLIQNELLCRVLFSSRFQDAIHTICVRSKSCTCKLSFYQLLVNLNLLCWESQSQTFLQKDHHLILELDIYDNLLRYRRVCLHFRIYISEFVRCYIRAGYLNSIATFLQILFLNCYLYWIWIKEEP